MDWLFVFVVCGFELLLHPFIQYSRQQIEEISGFIVSLVSDWKMAENCLKLQLIVRELQH